jgi:hypothetical protein
MALYSNRHWLLSHIRSAFCGTDDSGISEAVVYQNLIFFIFILITNTQFGLLLFLNLKVLKDDLRERRKNWNKFGSISGSENTHFDEESFYIYPGELICFDFQEVLDDKTID